MPLSLLKEALDLLALWPFEKLLLELSCLLDEENMLTDCVKDLEQIQDGVLLKQLGGWSVLYSLADNVVGGRVGRDRTRQQ